MTNESEVLQKQHYGLCLVLLSDHTLNTLDPECSAKWKKYLQLKQHFYMAYVSHTLDVCDACVCEMTVRFGRDLLRFCVILVKMKSVSMVFVYVVDRRTAIMDRLFWLLINVERPSDPCRRLRNVLNVCVIVFY